MNRPEPPPDIDADLRRLFAPDRAAVERVLAHVWRPHRPARKRGPWVWAAVVAATVGVTTIVAWRWQQLAPLPAGDSPLTIAGDHSLVVVERTADGRRWVVVPAQGGARVGNYVIVTGR